jgi:probable blue pigment (indigoidine) exporter
VNVERKPSTGWTALGTMLAPVAWGSTYVVVTEVLPPGRPLFVAAARVAPAAAVLLVAGAFGSHRRPRGREWVHTILVSTFSIVLFFPLLVIALYRLPGGVAAAVGGLQPLLVLGLSWAVSRQRPIRRNVTVACIAAIGVGMVVLRPGAGLDPIGLVVALAANVCFAVGVVLTQRFPTPSNRASSTGWQLAIGAMVLVPLSVLVEGRPPTLDLAAVVGLAYLSLIATGVAFLVWFSGVRCLPASAPPLLGLAAPVTGAALGWLILGQSMSPVQLAGFGVSIAAIAYGAMLGGLPPAAVRSVQLAEPARVDGLLPGRSPSVLYDGHMDVGVPGASDRRCPSTSASA